MSNEFWLGVVVTLLVGIPGAYFIAILANMHTPKLVSFLESRKLLKKHKTRQQALVVFNRIKSFHDGRADRYAHYILLSAGSVLCALSRQVFLNIFFNHVHDIPIGIDDVIVLPPNRCHIVRRYVSNWYLPDSQTA